MIIPIARCTNFRRIGGASSTTIPFPLFHFGKGRGYLKVPDLLVGIGGGGGLCKQKKEICLTFELCSHKMFSSFFFHFLMIITVDGSTHFSKWLQPAFHI